MYHSSQQCVTHCFLSEKHWCYKNMARQFFDRVDFADNRVDSEHNQVNSGDPHTTSFELTILKQTACHTFLAFLYHMQPCNQVTLQGQMIACNIKETTNLNWVGSCCLLMQATPPAKSILVCMTICCCRQLDSVVYIPNIEERPIFHNFSLISSCLNSIIRQFGAWYTCGWWAQTFWIVYLWTSKFNYILFAGPL